MDNPRIGSLNSLADYGLGESDIEDSDDEVQDEDSRVKLIPARPASIPAAQARVKTSARLVSYDDEVADEDEGEREKETKESGILAETQEDTTDNEKVPSTNDSSEEMTITEPLAPEPEVADAEKTAPEEKSSETAKDSDIAVKSKPIPAITMPQLPPEPTGRCSNKLQEKIIDLLEKRHRKNLDLNTNIQNRKDFRNPSTVAKPAPLIFTVTDRDETLGTASLPLAQIPSVAHRRRWLPLTTKNSQAMGDLCIDCWVLSFKKPSSSGGESGKWNNLIPSLRKSGNNSRERSKRRSSIEAASISKKGSRSIENLYSIIVELQSPTPCPSTSSNTLQPFPLFKPRLAPTLGQVLSSSNTPEITGLSPKSGPASGGTKITVRGCNLGKSKEDIVSVSICGCDLYSTLEYHSPAKLVVTTKPWAGSGPVVLETKSGGRGTSTVNFTFQDKPPEPLISALDRKGKVPRAELLTEITNLREEIVDLTGENRSLKEYIDRLMVVLMEKFPEVLENLDSSA